MRIHLSPDGPLDVPQTLARYRIWGEDPCNRLHDGVFRRVLVLDGDLHGYAIRWAGPPDDARIMISVPGSRSTRVAEAVSAEVGRLLFLDADVLGFYRAAKSDAVLQGLIAPFYGMRPTLTPRPFEMLVGAVTAQQVNLAFAVTIRGRLCRRFGRPLTVEGEPVHAFPAPGALAKAKVGDLRRMQFSTRKAEYIIGLARLVAREDLDFERLGTCPHEPAVAGLT